MLGLIVGDLGSGKTLFMTYVAQHTTDRPILANYELKLPNYQKLEPETLLTLPYPKALILIDEAYGWLESRTSGNKTNLYLSYILFQSRKRGLDIYLTSQLETAIDLRFRNMTNLLIECEKTKNGFYYNIIKRSFLHPAMTSRVLTFEKAEKYYKLYDTMQPVIPAQMEELAMDFVMSDKVKLKDLVNKAITDIGQLSKITRDSIELALREKGYPARLTRYVYLKLKDLAKA